MKSGWGNYLFLICLPTLFMASAGVLFLRDYAVDAQEEFVKASGRTVSLYSEEVRRACTLPKGRRTARLTAQERLEARTDAFSKWSPSEALPPAVARFIWMPRIGVVWARNLPEGLKTAIESKTLWREWTHLGRRSDSRGVMAFPYDGGNLHVWWTRHEDELYGSVFTVPPAGDCVRTLLFPIGGCIVALAVLVVVVTAWHHIREAAVSRKANELKTQFISDVSHDLRTPLAAIGVWIGLLKRGKLSPQKTAHAYDVISEENARMIRMVENLLDFGRLEQNRRIFARESVDLKALAEDAVETFRSDFAEHGISVTTAGVSEEGSAVALADVDAVKRILANLLGNAAKYASDGGPVAVAVGPGMLAVSDHGPGLTAEGRERCFERFWRSDDEAAAAKGGFGIGLSVSREFARGMGGDLAVAENAGGGCVFTLTLPLAAPESEVGDGI